MVHARRAEPKTQIPVNPGASAIFFISCERAERRTQLALRGPRSLERPTVLPADPASAREACNGPIGRTAGLPVRRVRNRFLEREGVKRERRVPFHHSDRAHPRFPLWKRGGEGFPFAAVARRGIVRPRGQMSPWDPDELLAWNLAVAVAYLMYR